MHRCTEHHRGERHSAKRHPTECRGASKSCLLLLLNTIVSISVNNTKELDCYKLCQIFHTNPTLGANAAKLFASLLTRKR
jgi:hypothetical protein